MLKPRKPLKGFQAKGSKPKTTGSTKVLWPMRINRYLAQQQKVTTRTAADELVDKGLILINGVKARLGDKVEKTDVVTVSPKARLKKYTYLAYHKPVGIATHSSTDKEKDIAATLKLDKDIFPIGRLDKDSSGLIILTSDGRVTDALLNPDKNHEKEYIVTVNKTVTEEMVRKMAGGIRIEGYLTKKALVRKTGDKEITIIITEGKKHQIRRMVVACGYEVIRLVRIRIMNIELTGLEKGAYRPIEGEELKTFLQQLSLI
jgi:23S rRNA pseudouridine2604 synthase